MADNLVIWRHFRIEVPAGWEMLRYSRRREAGRCSFMDRTHVRLEMSWRQVPGAPDRERMLSDYMTRLEEQDVTDLRRQTRAGWDGLVGVQDGRPVSRFGRYFEGESCLLELVFPWPQERDAEVERRVLAGVAEEPVRDGTRRWRAFGLDMAVPEGLELTACGQHAARAEFTFQAARGVDEMRFMRLGMVSTWQGGTVRDWLRAQVPARVRVDREMNRTVDGNEVACVTGRAKRWFRGLRLRRPVYEAWAGICAGDGRLYFVSRQGRGPGDGGFPLPVAASVSERTPGGQPCARSRSQLQGEGGEWAAMLQARPLRNRAARVEERDGSVVLHVPRTPEKDLRPPLSWIVPVRRERRTSLAGVGREVWALCDGVRRVEDVIDVFATRHALTFHEARVSVTGFVKDLIQRGILAIEVPD